MGEEPWRVHHSGCPSIDVLEHGQLTLPAADYFANRGVGVFDPAEPYVLLLQHPVTTSFGSGGAQITESLYAVRDLPLNKLVLWPNADAGSDDVAKAIRDFQHDNGTLPFSYQINFPPDVFASLLANAKCLVGNSSSFIREGSFLGTPAVIVGDRQEGREHGRNVVHAPYDRRAIGDAMRRQLEHGRYPGETIFGDGQAGARIAKHLETARLDLRKRHA